MKKLNEIENCLLVSLEVSITTPARKATASDLGLKDIPPGDLATLGSFRIFDPEETKPLFTLKRQAERALFEVGAKFGRMGVIIPPSAQVKTIDELEIVRQKFDARRSIILASFQDKQEDWFTKYPEYEEILRAKQAESRRDIARGILFGYTACAIGYSANGNLEGKVSSLHEQVISDVSTEAKSLLDSRFIGSDKIRWQTVETIRKLRNKVNDLAFLNQSLSVIVRMMDEVLDKHTIRKPWIAENAFMEMMGMLFVLSDPLAIKRHANQESGLNDQLDITAGDEDLIEQDNVMPTAPTPRKQVGMASLSFF